MKIKDEHLDHDLNNILNPKQKNGCQPEILNWLLDMHYDFSRKKIYNDF